MREFFKKLFSKENLNIRPYDKEKDFEKLVELQIEVEKQEYKGTLPNDEYLKDAAKIFLLVYLSPEDIEGKKPYRIAYVLENDSTLLGFIVFRIDRDDNSADISYVRSYEKGKKYGEKLLQYVINLLREDKTLNYISLQAYDYRLRNIYTSLGFKEQPNNINNELKLNLKENL